MKKDEVFITSAKRTAVGSLNKSLKNIVLGHPKSKLSCLPDIFIPVGVPGIDYEGIMFRTDNVVSLPLKKIRDVALPTIDDIVREIT